MRTFQRESRYGERAVKIPNAMELGSGVIGVLVLGFVACDFAGDRSLGTVASRAGSSAMTDSHDVSQAGGADSGSGDAAHAGGAVSISVSTSSAAPQQRPCIAGVEPSECESDEFCATAAYCGQDAATSHGVCMPRPTECPPSLDGNLKVCGCDGMIYESRCLAELDGIAVADLSYCDPVPCTSAEACEDYATGCIESFEGTGQPSVGVICLDGACSCRGSAVLL